MSYVAWMVESTVNDRAALDAVMADLVAAVEANEPPTTHYEWSLSADGSRLFNYDRFEDSDAAMAHLAAFGPFAERYMAALTPIRFVVYGSPSEEVMSATAAFSPEAVTPIGGFAR
jgi:quinol monooxygenase YgiN